MVTEKIARYFKRYEAAKPCLDEMDGLLELGLAREAVEVGERHLAGDDFPQVRRMIIAAAMNAEDLPTATRHALYLYEHNRRELAECKIGAIVLHYAGYLREAYEVTKLDRRMDPGQHTAYCLACRAWPLGRLEEAFRSLMDVFRRRDPEEEPNAASYESAWRQVFLDSELRPVWEYAAKRPVKAPCVLRWINYPLDEVVAVAAPTLPPRDLDFSDLPSVPDDVLPHLRSTSCNTKRFDPVAAAEFPEIFQKYLAWEAGRCAPTLAALQGFQKRLHETYDRMVPAMAEFCARRERPGTGRFIVRQYLRRHPETDPETFPEIPGMEYWAEEWRGLWKISQSGTWFLLHHRPGALSRDDFETTFEQLPEALRNSGLGWFVLGCELSGSRPRQALEAFLTAQKFWPLDDALHHNILICLCRLELWEKAEAFVEWRNFLPQHPEIRAHMRQAIKYKSCTLLPPDPERDTAFPTPAYNLLDKDENALFLRKRSLLVTPFSNK